MPLSLPKLTASVRHLPLPQTVLRLLFGVTLACLWAGQVHAQDCRIAFDLGSSGVRAAASGLDANAAAEPVGQLPWRDIDMLAPLVAGRFLDPLVPAVEAALRELPQQAMWRANCQRLGGGFSAWRLAWRLDGPRLAAQLARLREQTGVAVLVIPVTVEGRYGYASAQQALGPRLATSHILDIGGGSMQVAGQDSAFGIELGQKSWQRLLCQTLGRGTEAPCALQPLQPGELQQVRALMDEQLRELPAAVGPGTLTAISRPVTRGIRTAMQGLGLEATDAIDARDLSTAIERLSAMDLTQTLQATQTTGTFAGFLLSDMLMVEGVLRATHNRRLMLAEASINNLTALLRDERAFAWTQQHACYVQRLREIGPAAYFSDPLLDCAKP